MKAAFLEALAEREDHGCHRTRKFPRLGSTWLSANKQPVYRADIDKISGWRIHVHYDGGQIHLKDVIEGQKHDDVLGQIEAKKIRYERKPPGAMR